MKSEKRIDTLLQFLRDDPDDAFTMYILALEYIKEGNNGPALEWMEKIHFNHPAYLPNYYHYGKLLERMGKAPEAMSIYQEGITKAQIQNDLHTLSELRSAMEDFI